MQEYPNNNWNGQVKVCGGDESCEMSCEKALPNGNADERNLLHECICRHSNTDTHDSSPSLPLKNLKEQEESD